MQGVLKNYALGLLGAEGTIFVKFLKINLFFSVI